MDYKEKYEQGLECIQEILSSGQEKIKMTLLKERLQPFFPELGESEDELTWLTKFIEEEAYSLSMDIRDNEDRIKLKNLQKSLAWLEKQKEMDKEIVFRPLLGTDIRIAAKQALEKIEIGKKVVLAFNGAYIPVEGKTVAEICNEYDTWIEKQGQKTSWKPSKEEMDVLYGLAYITNQYDEHKEEVITRLYQDLKREFFNGSSYENMFPTNTNTEDEVRRRSIIEVLEYARSLNAYNQYGKEDIDIDIAWLEKQGEAKYKIKGSDSLSVNGQPFDNEKATITQKDFEEIVNAVKDTSILDMVEPKFKVGDFILNGDVTNDGKPEIFKVQKICPNWYDVENIYDGRKTIITFNQEWSCKLWNIKDAEDGDVLVDSLSGDNQITILFKCIELDASIRAYCGWNHYNFRVTTDGTGYGTLSSTKYVPATKEQHDLLFQKMEEEGYEWDAENKELKKITTPQSKFKVGDWVKYCGKPYQITGLHNDTFTLTSCDGSYFFNNVKNTKEPDFLIWTIQDAKDGDVLVCNEEIALFKSYSVQGRISLYCWYNGQTNNFYSEEVNDASLTTRNKICPATKEQRDTLFKKIKEAGYEWDAKKKELKLLISNGGDFN